MWCGSLSPPSLDSPSSLLSKIKTTRVSVALDPLVLWELITSTTSSSYVVVSKRVLVNAIKSIIKGYEQIWIEFCADLGNALPMEEGLLSISGVLDFVAMKWLIVGGAVTHTSPSLVDAVVVEVGSILLHTNLKGWAPCRHSYLSQNTWDVLEAWASVFALQTIFFGLTSPLPLSPVPTYLRGLLYIYHVTNN